MFLTRAEGFDKVLIITVLLLLIFGIMILISASHQKRMDTGKNFLFNQGIWIVLGMLLMFLVAKVSYNSFLSVAYIIYGINIVFLTIVLVFGRIALGAQRWISIGGVGFQPSEFSKIFTILVLARLIGDNPQCLKNIRGLIWPVIVVFIPMVLIFKQPDLGTAIIFLPIFISILWAGGIRLKYFLTTLISGVLMLPFFWHFLRDYQKNRLLVFINPNLDPLGAGYTINQSKISIGSGMLIGKGWFAGTQNRLNFLPERHTDFIFSVIGEEWGFIGTSLLIVFFIVLISRGFKIADTTNDLSGRLVAVGVTTMVALHVIINIGMTLGLMPVVGVPLPFISYGGSALVSNMIAAGFLLNVKMHRTVF